MNRLFKIILGGGRGRAALCLMAVAAPLAMDAAPASAAVRVGVATWDESAPRGTCTIAHEILGLGARAFWWECAVEFVAEGTHCTIVHPLTLTVTSCKTTLKFDFRTPATKTSRGWLCPGFDTAADFTFYDGYSGVNPSASATVTVATNQADLDENGEQTILAESAATYRGTYVNVTNNLMVHFFGTFTLACSRLTASEGTNYKGELVMDQAP